MKTILVAVALSTLLAACGDRAPLAQKPTPEGAATAADPEKTNLLSMARGASILSRTGELTLEQTPARTIDGDATSTWTTPPRDVQQSCVLTLPARARITSFGAATASRPAFAAKNVRFETSVDGVNFITTATMALKAEPAMQTQRVPPVEAQFVRFSIENGRGDYVSLTGLQAHGQLLAASQLPSIHGCWEVNGAQASLQKNGNAVHGWIDWEGTLLLTGGAADHYYRFAWIDGPQYGLALMTVTPDGRHFTGLKWHERAEPLTFGTTWFADKGSECDAKGTDAAAVAQLWLERAGRFPLYGLRFDAQDHLAVADSETSIALILAIAGKSQRVTLTANELREATPAANRARTDLRISSLRAELARRGLDPARVDYISAGSNNPPERLPSELTLGMYSAVDIRVAGPAV